MSLPRMSLCLIMMRGTTFMAVAMLLVLFSVGSSCHRFSNASAAKVTLGHR